MKPPRWSRARRRGFTLIELLTVIAVIGILAVILLPTIGGVEERARRAAAASQLRRIHGAYLAYTTATPRARTLRADTIYGWARTLAQAGAGNAAELYLVTEDPLIEPLERLPTVVATPPPGGEGDWQVAPDFEGFPLSVVVVSGLSSQAPDTTPLAWTRGLQADGRWAPREAPNPGVYGAAGGFVLFLSGAVEFYPDLNADGGKLINYRTGQPTGTMSEALSPGAVALDYRGSPF